MNDIQQRIEQAGFKVSSISQWDADSYRVDIIGDLWARKGGGHYSTPSFLDTRLQKVQLFAVAVGWDGITDYLIVTEAPVINE